MSTDYATVEGRYVEASGHIFECGDPEYVEHLPLGAIKALLNPKKCEYRLLFGRFSLGVRTETIYIIKAGEEGNPACSYACETKDRNYAVDRDALMRCFLLSDTVELLECKPFVEKPKPLTCYASFEDPDKPVLCVVGRNGDTTFFYEGTQYPCSVLDRDTITALSNLGDCGYNIRFHDNDEAKIDTFYVEKNSLFDVAERIAAGSFRCKWFSIRHLCEV